MFFAHFFSKKGYLYVYPIVQGGLAQTREVVEVA
jgi:hypothetical protein